MTTLTTLLATAVIILLLGGVFFLIFPESTRLWSGKHLRRVVTANLVFFSLGLIGLLVIGISEVSAAEAALTTTREISLGHGLALIGVGLPTALATIGAGIAVSSVGSASLAVITEKPELFGRTLIYLGLAEGIAIYGLVVSILLLGKI